MTTNPEQLKDSFDERRRSPISSKERQIDMMTDDLRRSIERLNKVIENSTPSNKMKYPYMKPATTTKKREH